MAQSREDDPSSQRAGRAGSEPTATPQHRHPRAEPAPYEPSQRLWGTRPGRLGVVTVLAGTVLGAAITVISGSEPSWALGLLLVISTAIGALAVNRRQAYLVIPVPALAYTVAAFATGYIHDHSIVTSKTTLAVSAVQWIADGFFAMTAATLVAIVIVVGRGLFTGPGARRAYGDMPVSQALRGIRYRFRGDLDTAAGRERRAGASWRPAGPRPGAESDHSGGRPPSSPAGRRPAAEPQPGADSSPSGPTTPAGPRHSA